MIAEYKGYYANVPWWWEHGESGTMEVLGSGDRIEFTGNRRTAEQNFHQAVDEYLLRCAENGKDPSAAALTPERFAMVMREIAHAYDSDPETAHVDADDLMCCLLRQLGYGDGVDVFVNMYKWYA